MWLAARKPSGARAETRPLGRGSGDHLSSEAAVEACYSTWSGSYYEDYYGDKASYPPVHRELLKGLLSDAGAVNVLDAGCGPASFLRDLVKDGIEVYGFDLTSEMVGEAKRVLAEQGVSPDRIWQGSVLSPESFRIPGTQHKAWFDAAVCIGVMPHIPEEREEDVIGNLHGAVKAGGLVVLEARNQLFSLFTLNRYSYQFFLDELIRADSLKAKADRDETRLMEALDRFGKMFRIDLPPVRKGKAEEPGYDEVLSRAHNPFILKKRFAAAGFVDVRLLFYHYHCLPPMLQSEVPDLFRRESLAQEDPHDWRGYFMASAFMLAGKRK
jgi:2-polyprenyl-3-methyl-5-hydroxy-6-metoxy-1,4-benzoquinol methylase